MSGSASIDLVANHETEGDSGDASPASDPALNPRNPDDREPTKTERRCIATRGIHPKSELLRFVIDGDRNLVADFDQRLPGRGAYLMPNRAVAAQALAKGLFARAFKGKTTAAPDFLERLEQIARQRVMGRLGLISRAGHLLTGAEKVGAGMIGPQLPKSVKLYVHANDAAANGLDKLRAKARASATPFRMFSDMSTLSDALGRPNVAHIAVVEPHQANTLAKSINLVEGLSDRDQNVTAPDSGNSAAKDPRSILGKV